MIKKFIISLLIFIIIVSPINAMTLEIRQNTNDEITSESAVTINRQVEIINIVKNDADYYLKFVRKNNIIVDSSKNIELNNISYIKFPETVFVQMGKNEFKECKINWENTDNIDTSKEGRIEVYGRIIPPDGIEFTSGLPPIVKMPLLIYDTDISTEYASVYGLADYTLLVPYGCNLMDYINQNNTFSFLTEHGDWFYCPVVWTDIPNTNTVGEIYMKGEFVIPDGIIPKDDKSKYITQKFYVMKTDDIYMDYIEKTPYQIGCTWLKEIEDYENIIIEYSTDGGGVWRNADKITMILDTCFYILFYTLEPNTEYIFRLKYKNKIYGYLNIETNEENDIRKFYIGGDRDLGDNKEIELPVFTHSQKQGSVLKRKIPKDTKKNIPQKIFEITSENSNEKTSETVFTEYQVSDNLTKTLVETEKLTETTTEEVFEKNIEITTSYTDKESYYIVSSDSEADEEITPKKTVLSGKRLIEQANVQGSTITFEKQGVSLEIPSKFIKENKIEKDDLIAVSIEKKENKVNINVSVNDKPVEKIEGSKIVMLDKNNKPKKFNADKTGEYAIPDNNTDNKIKNKIIFTILIILIVGALHLIWRKRKL